MEAIITTPIHVEVCQKNTSIVKSHDLSERVTQFIHTKYLTHATLPTLPKDGFLVDYAEDQFLAAHVMYARVCEIEVHSGGGGVLLHQQQYQLHVHVYQLDEDGPGVEMQDGNDTPACQQWILPSTDFDGLWESLVYEEQIKSNLLSYITTSLLFSDKAVDSNIISCNRVALLHGPPGTGKTSLCKALSQKLAIRLSHRYTQGQLVEINAHSLFSKWFSESGKMVLKMFDKIREIIEDDDTFVCVLIDEIESLTAARKAAIGGNEPSDALRVVNAVLTQLDRLKQYKNVIVLTTTNITQAVDGAFVDRADIALYIGPPSISARYMILASCAEELIKKGLIYPRQPLMDFRSVKFLQNLESETSSSQMLLHTAEKAEGFSGRALRKLPFLAHAFFLQGRLSFTLEEFITALAMAIDKDQKNRNHMQVL